MSQGPTRYYVADLDTPSTTNLLTPSGQQSVQAALLRGPRSIRPTLSSASLNESPYPLPAGNKTTIAPSISDKFSLSPDPASWGSDLSPSHPEPDDYLHNPDPRRDRKNDKGGTILTYRGLTNLGCLVLLVLALLTLFAGYPVITYFTKSSLSRQGGFNFGGLNSSGQVPEVNGGWGLIDVDTPKSLWTRPSFHDPTQELQLVFSDEFNVDGRTFYPGDDPYWEALDLHYWQTGNLEWYDPAAITTKNGALVITLSEKPNHGLQYMGGMMTTWNKFCFTGGLFETSVTLPGANNVVGLWPAVWTMGNLGRAGYGASLEGMWPYTYDSCDVGTAPNQTQGGLPLAATTDGDPYNGNVLSYLQGQRLSRCTCAGESHPGPLHEDGTFVGRSAPEIDVFEATVHTGLLTGQVSQSCQFAPFNYNYTWPYQNDSIIYDPDITEINPYKGGVFQQAVSGLTDTNQTAYELNGGDFAVYGFEYKPGTDNAYITWISNNQSSWTLLSSGTGADPVVEISARPIPQEPMYLIANLGISPQFGRIDFDHLQFPTTMRIDYVRVYQPKDRINIGCDPEAFPTMAYINQYIEAYTNYNLTTWRDDFKQTFPKSRFLGQC
ncbi:beta-glucan synthesis-associated [Multifurca ochricompacta]|uniref:Beta-glucan synthesis-associated n=1 Tax=Multifurca ochricompacta TaxID=376703 RepID=A0AAD4MD52_9AGAM|nr:beta-glucan synthesis-associated [Multifurca ochricompacta]